MSRSRSRCAYHKNSVCPGGGGGGGGGKEGAQAPKDYLPAHACANEIITLLGAVTNFSTGTSLTSCIVDHYSQVSLEECIWRLC